MNNFAKNLKALRKTKKWSQAQLARKINENRRTVASWEEGKAIPRTEKMMRICKILGITNPIDFFQESWQ